MEGGDDLMVGPGLRGCTAIVAPSIAFVLRLGVSCPAVQRANLSRSEILQIGWIANGTFTLPSTLLTLFIEWWIV
jgi:hypothetical protein